MTSPVQYHYGKVPAEKYRLAASYSADRGPANAALADGTLAVIPNHSILLAPLTTQEAVLSSKIRPLA